MNKINTFINTITDYAFLKEDRIRARNGLKCCLSMIFNTQVQVKDNQYTFRLRRAQNVSLKVISDRLTFPGLIASSVKSYLFHCMALPIYRTIDLSNRQVKILLKGYVQNDGVGDYFYMIRVARVLQRALPCASITIAAEVQGLDARRKQFPDSEFNTIFWGVQSREGDCRINYEEGGYKERALCLKLAEEADVILDLPHSKFENSSFTIEDPDFEHKSQRITELGAGRFLEVPPPHHLMSMGVRAFEYGLIFSERSITGSLNDLSSQSLKEFFFDPEFLVKDGGEKEYQASHRLHFAYLHDRTRDFIQLCLMMNQKDDKSIIDIVTNQDLFYFEEEMLKKHNVKRIVAYSSSPNGMTKNTRELNASGKTLRLFTAFPIPNQDLQIVASLSNDCIGCTGDNSLLDILSRGQLPFYEIVDHKRMFWSSLCQLANEFFGTVDTPLVSYLNQLPRRYENPDDHLNRLAELLQDRRIYDECRQFCGFLRQHYNFNETLIDVVHKKLACSLNPGIRKLQEELLKSYNNDEMTLPECQVELEAFISNNRM